MRRFRAAQDFISPDTKSAYCKDLTYTVRENPKLEGLVHQWVKEGKAQWLDDAGQAVSGNGQVQGSFWRRLLTWQ
jgi:hypothetical protein